ncbi:hypothetical protein [Ruegeria sp. HKCCC2117]|uniref:hypothetical protein n=1 Tax=Ruegeria sp. HKCCC2117 TaxID=2682992 RepID=UPI001488B620|nr:hypothetical protein [Ruegeria sp. HKCCC2117]
MSVLDEMRNLLGPEVDEPKSKRTKLKNLELTELSLVDVGANQHAEIVLMKSLGADTELVHSGTPEANRLLNNMRILAKQEEEASKRAKPTKPNHTPISDDELEELQRNSRAKSPDDPAATLASLRDLLEQMQNLLTPETPTSDRVVDASITDPSAADQRRANALQNEGQSEADAQQAARDAEDQARQDLFNSVGAVNNANMLAEMMRIVGAMNPNGDTSG